MNCQKLKRWLPLAVGRDLPSSRMKAVENHLIKCPRCRLDYEALKRAVKRTKEWLRADMVDWSEAEWKAVIRKALDAEKKRAARQSAVPFLAPWPFRKGWAYAVMAGATLILSWFIWGPALNIREKGFRAQGPSRPETTMILSAQQDVSQDIVSMTIISKETGLKINWFFNKNFEWEEKK